MKNEKIIYSLICFLFILLNSLIGVGHISASSLATAKSSSDKGKIVFSSVASGNWELWSIKPDGKDMKKITNTPEDEHSPAVSPDGREIIYVDNRTIRTINSDGKNKRELPLPEGIYAQPAWSPNGKEVAFVKYKVIPNDQSEIWIIKRKGHEWGMPERISKYPPMRVYPSFSSDGSKLIYAEVERDRLLGVIEEIGIIDLNKQVFQEITNDRADSFEPAWSPNGDRIAYTSNQSGNYNIWVMSLKDNKQRQLTINPSYDGHPAWSLDGNEIVFVSTRTGSQELWIMSATGNGLRQLTNTGRASKDPFWAR